MGLISGKYVISKDKNNDSNDKRDKNDQIY